MTTYPNAHYLAEVDWLAAHLKDANVVVLDARFDVRTDAKGHYHEVAGRDGFLKGHIAGAQFVDLKADLACPKNPTCIIGADAFAALMGRLGVTGASTVVVYDDKGGVWAARLWWALRYYGHDNVKMLNGGLGAWRAAGHSLQTDVTAPEPAQFTAKAQTNLRVEKHDVLAAIDDKDTVIIDALPKPFYYGKAVLYPQCRKGHVPGAYNVPAEYNLDPKTGRVRPLADLQDLWKHVTDKPARRYITYCGGGVFASFALFILALMGYGNAALYDASWTEWGADDSLPIETGASPIT